MSHNGSAQLSGRLTGDAVIVTGGASGLGRAIVDRFVAEGAQVVVLDRSADKLRDLAARHRAAVRTVVGDVTSFDDNAAAVDLAVSDFGRLDTFVGNAGLWDFSRSLLDTDPEALAAGFDELFAVNVKGYLLGAKAAAPALAANNGNILFTLSNASFYPGGGGPIYTAAKHASLGLVRQLAYELAPTVRVNAVAPGGMATDLRGPGAMGLDAQSITDAVPIDAIVTAHSAMHTSVRPDDAVSPYVLLASRTESRAVTGAVIDISTLGIPARPSPEPVPM